MASYKAPLRDVRFALHELHDSAALSELPGFEEMTPELLDAVLEEAAKICEEVLHPLNRNGDEQGCTYDDGVVRTPKGFPEAYQLFREGGWTSIGCDPAYGGQGLPKSLTASFEEMINAANLSFGLYPGLTRGAYAALRANGSDILKKRYLPKLVDGTWSGTMCLTEPHCGTDLGMCRTKAVPSADGSYRITGTKIFISAGDHDLTENIIHLLLARLPDAPLGIKGISMFLVPKFIPDENGNPSARNGVHCGSIEHKMGMKASATCVLNFEDATGWLIGEPHKGMRAMFTMMNEERLFVGIQGLGVAEAAYQGAVTYARDRLQGRSLAGAKRPDLAADPIIVHPDVRRMLLTMRANAEGCRALSAWVARAVDVKEQSPEPHARRDAEDFLALMTPILKALLTDLGFESANLGVQVLGGHGYIREHGLEQLVRDVRITQIYEGTNGVQALDLVGRKLGAHMGRYLRQFFHPVHDFVVAHDGDQELARYVEPLRMAFARLQQATGHIARIGLAKPEEVGAVATEYLRLFGLVALAYLWSRSAQVALAKLKQKTAEVSFYQAKLATAAFFMDKLLPQVRSLFSSIMAGGATVVEFPEDAF